MDLHALRNDIQVYREGAIELHRANPNYHFTSAAGVVDSIACVRNAIQRF